jgi:outer membrane protein OmpA-like peptidoglycan-associated protein
MIALAALALCLAQAGAETFRYRFENGDTVRINSVVRESVLVNRRLSHEAEITNRITATVSDVRPAAGGKPASARYDGTFMTSERNSNRSFAWGEEYKSTFRRDELGVYEIGDEFFMPVVRNVPVFPDRDLKPGDSWTAAGEEAHDFRPVFGIPKPYRVPFTANYVYEGPVEKDGKLYQLIRVEYTIFFNTPREYVRSNGAPRSDKATDYPVSMMGSSRQHIYWESELGMVRFYEEEFLIKLVLASGTTIEYRGVAEATVTDVTRLDRAKVAREMNEEIEKLGIEDVTAKETDEGVTISLERIQFEADSARLLPSEKEKITKIAALLERYPDKELLVSGHTALAGTASARQKLSEERAEAVARFLVEMGVRSPYSVFTRGFGAEKPIAPNDTEENMARNRRVEITILEK